MFIVSFITLLYLDLEASETTITIEETDVVEVIDEGEDEVVIEAEIDTVTIDPPKETRTGSWMETIYLGIPNTNPLLSVATAVFNAALLLMTLDVTFRAYLFLPATDLSFHRPIPTSPYAANIFIRSPPEESPLQIYFKPIHQPNWRIKPVTEQFTNESDVTAVITLDGLKPSTLYEYAVLPKDTDIDSATKYSSFGTFETFPPKGKGGRWSFGSSSCIKPGLPYNPLGHPLRLKGIEYLEKEHDLKFFTFLGISHPSSSS
jgi:alkaline phosphatase D